MNIPIPAVLAASRGVVREFGRGLSIVGATVTEGSTGRVEILVTVHGCHQGDCRVVINVARTDLETFDQEFRQKLREAMQSHCR